jgi:amidase
MPTPDLDSQSASATQLVEALAARRIGALELCDATIAFIERRDTSLNAVVVRDFERAREQARAADALLARGERRPLLGLPMTVKEAFDVAGLATTWGHAFARTLAVREDAVAVARLKAAGAVILGKTNVALGLADYQSDNPVYGRTQHPHDDARTPGGSSGGSAAAVASGMVALEVGSDIGGSIRVPAHFCGVYGHKPSHALLPMRGHDFPGVTVVAPDPLAVIGPLARSAIDLDLALDVLAGPDVHDATAYRLALPAPRSENMQGLRVLVVTEHPIARTAAEVKAAIDAVAERLARAGARVERHSDLLPELGPLHGLYTAILSTIVTRGAPGGPPSIPAHEWMKLMDQREQLRNRWRALFERFDVILAPPFGTVAFQHLGTPDWDRTALDIDGEATPYRYQLAWAGLATVAGLPATVAPAGVDRYGLPIGVQIIGPLLEDRTTIAVARWLEREV